MSPQDAARATDATTDTVAVRRSELADVEQVVEVCRSALAWNDGELDAAFFRWKHFENPFGVSPIWVAEERSSGEIVGVRTMMRWQLARGDEVLNLARAVDTATLPSHQGKGIFTKLTSAAVGDLEAAGVDAIFNTPNDKSRPGYLKMGWTAVGRVPVKVRPRSPSALLAMAKSVTAAAKWGIPTDVGIDPHTAWADEDAVDAALGSAAAPKGWSTPISLDYLRWRTALPRLECRVQPLGDSLADGFVVFRLRERGAIRQLSILHAVHAPTNQPRRAIGRLLAESGAHVVVSSGPALGLRNGLVGLSRSGPLLTWRALRRAAQPEIDDIHLDLGSLELF